MGKHCLKFIVFASFIFGIAASAQKCPPDNWCQIYSKPLLRNNGYNAIFFAPGVNKFFLYAGNANAPATLANGPEGTTFWEYSLHDTPVSTNPWTQLSDCNDNANTEIRQQMLKLHRAMSETDTTAELCVGQSCAAALTPQNTIPQEGFAWIGDESISYKGCTGVEPATPGACGRGTKIFRLDNVARGVRQPAGWRPAYAHAVGEQANLSCPAPTLHQTPTIDHPPSRHSAQNATFDSLRGAIWLAWGWQENWSLQDTWYLCLKETAFCTATKIRDGWQRLPLFSSQGEEPGNYAENATIYDPDNDVLVSFGGLKGGNATSETFVFCLSDKAYGCSARTLNKWVKVATHGNPGPRDAARLAYDKVNHRILAFGGQGNSATGFYNSVAIYNAATGDWCLSETGVGGASNASSCKYPKMTGTPPPRERSTKFPSWCFDGTRGKGAFFNGKNIYEYDTAKNEWILTKAPEGPTGGAFTQQSHQSWAHDDVNDVFVWVSSAQLWQLPGAALSK